MVRLLLDEVISVAIDAVSAQWCRLRHHCVAQIERSVTSSAIAFLSGGMSIVSVSFSHLPPAFIALRKAIASLRIIDFDDMASSATEAGIIVPVWTVGRR